MFSFVVLLYLGELISPHDAERVPYKIESQSNMHGNMYLLLLYGLLSQISGAT